MLYYEINYLVTMLLQLQKRMKTKFHQNKFAQKKKQFIARAEQTARAEILNHEDEGLVCYVFCLLQI